MLSSWKDVLTDKGYVRVSEHLEVHGHPGVFAVGDIVDWPEQKQAAKAMWHAPVASAGGDEVVRAPTGRCPGYGCYGVRGGGLRALVHVHAAGEGGG